MTVNFNLTGRNKDTVRARVYWSGQEYTRSLDMKISAQYWDAAKQRVRISPDYLPARHINRVLDQTRKELEERYWEQRAELGRDLTKTEVEALFLPRQSKVVLLSEFAAKQTELLKSRTNKITGVKVKETTVLKQLNVIRHVQELEKKIGPLPLEKCDISFYRSYVDYMVAAGYSMNYIGKHLSIIRSWLREADAAGLVVHPAFKSKEWYIGRERTSHLVLNLEQLSKIAELELDGKLAQVRDLFLLSAYTGLRYSDVSRLNRAEFKDGLIILEQQKTSGMVAVPELPEVTSILKKYRDANTFPRVYHNYTMNLALKEIGELAGLTDTWVHRRTQGGERVHKQMRICDAITTHTARRSFATNLFVSGFNLSWTSMVLGHSSQEQTIEYISMDGIEKAKLLAQHWKTISGHS